MTVERTSRCEMESTKTPGFGRTRPTPMMIDDSSSNVLNEDLWGGLRERRARCDLSALHAHPSAQSHINNRLSMVTQDRSISGSRPIVQCALAV